jgi:hypothetical protein
VLASLMRNEGSGCMESAFGAGYIVGEIAGTVLIIGLLAACLIWVVRHLRG